MRKILNRIMKLNRLVRKPGYRRGLRQGVGAATEHETLMASLRVGSAIDVGANKGQFSLMLKELHPTAPIHAFEPLVEAAIVFERLFDGVAGITLHRVAAGTENRETEINLSGSADSSSLLPISVLQDEAFPGTASVARRTIQMRRIDDVLKDWTPIQPLLIKLDVQGYELEALRGMPALLGQAAYVYAELSFFPFYDAQPLAAELVAWLAEQGFELAYINDVSRTSKGFPAQADVLFWRDSSSRLAHV